MASDFDLIAMPLTEKPHSIPCIDPTTSKRTHLCTGALKDVNQTTHSSLSCSPAHSRTIVGARLWAFTAYLLLMNMTCHQG